MFKSEGEGQWGSGSIGSHSGSSHSLQYLREVPTTNSTSQSGVLRLTPAQMLRKRQLHLEKAVHVQTDDAKMSVPRARVLALMKVSQ